MIILSFDSTVDDGDYHDNLMMSLMIMMTTYHHDKKGEFTESGADGTCDESNIWGANHYRWVITFTSYFSEKPHLDCFFFFHFFISPSSSSSSLS